MALVIDPDNFEGGRRQKVTVAGRSLGLIESFQDGRWLEQHITPRDSSDGTVLVEAHNARDGSNAVISII